jgi:hypothetical protein
MIFPLDPDGVLYALQDEKGNQIGVGSRDVCQTLLYLVTNSPLMSRPQHATAQGAAMSRAKVSARTTAALK